jgi:uncharacterized protein YecE (DUF72 family)
MAKVFIGMSGWTFPGWRGDFYPNGLVQKNELAYASRQVNSIEINGTFYSLQRPPTFQKWYAETPEDFCFSLKGPQYITHIRRLKDVKEPLCNFLASGVLCLKEKLGPLLWQFPPNVMLKDDRFEKFLELLPRDTKEAAAMAKEHTSKMDGRAFTKAEGNFPLRHVFEFRHPSFKDKDFIKLMAKHNVAIVVAHSGLKSPYIEDLTSDFVYGRMHGQEPKFKKGYTKDVISWLSERVKCWSEGNQPEDAHCVAILKPKSMKRDVFIYFDTEEKKYAPHDAVHLIQALGARAVTKKIKA